MKKVDITEFFDTQYLDYSKYVVKDRAIPSLFFNSCLVMKIVIKSYAINEYIIK